MQKAMDILLASDEVATASERPELATWNRQRTNEELRSFVSDHYDKLPDDLDVDL